MLSFPNMAISVCLFYLTNMIYSGQKAQILTLENIKLEQKAFLLGKWLK